MISQVLTDFKGAIRGNIGTEVQMHSRYEGDIKRVRERHGREISQLISKMPVSIGMVESAGMNKGNPYFIEFRPVLHSPLKLGEKEILDLVRRERPALLEIPVISEKRAGGGSAPDHRAFLEGMNKKSKQKAKKKKGKR